MLMHEVDIVLERDDGMIAGIEVKASATVWSDDFAGLRTLALACGKRFAHGVVGGRLSTSLRVGLFWMRNCYTSVFPAGARRAAEHYRLTCSVIRESLRLCVFLIAGVAVTGCGGGSGSSEGPDPTPANAPPTADAGADRTVDELTLVVLSGSAQDRDGTIRTWQWTQISGPEVELENADTAEARFTAPDGPSGSAELAFRLTVTDDRGGSASDEVAIMVNFANSPPVVRGGTHVVELPGRSVGVGIIAEDPDGTVESFEWVQVLGPDVVFRSDPDGRLYFSTPTELPDDGSDSIELAFLLTVTDDQGATATDRVTCTVVFYNSLPTANAGADRTVDEGDWVTLSGSASDSDGSIVSVLWAQLSGPSVELLDSHRLVAGFNAPEAPDGAADLAFRLTVMDNRGATAIDQVVVSLHSNSPPSADAGPDRTVEERARVTLSGSAEDPDGTIRSSRWTQVSGPPVELLDPGALAAGFTAPEMSTGADVLAFRLTVTDDKGAAASDEVSITVADEGAVKVSGAITFDYVPATTQEGLQYGATEARPVHGVTVELRGGADSRLIDAAVTGENGGYALYALPDTSVFVRARAEIPDVSGSWDVRVATDGGGGAGCGSDTEYPLYAMDSEPFDMPDSAVTRDLHAASGWTGDSYGEARVAAPFAILDVIFDAMQIVRATAGDVDFRPLHVFWGHENVGANHTSCQDKSIIRLSGAENENTDEYDRSVIAHEWSHYLHASFSRNDTLSGPHNPLYDHLEIATAFSEGLASALGAVVSDDAAYTNTFGPQQGVTEGFSVENTTHTGRGWFIEASIAQIVYDLIDPANDDTVELGFGQILEVLTDDLSETRSLTSIFFVHPRTQEPCSGPCARHRFHSGLSPDTADRRRMGQHGDQHGREGNSRGIAGLCGTRGQRRTGERVQRGTVTEGSAPEGSTSSEFTATSGSGPNRRADTRLPPR